jgi:hypothetical protein
MPQQGPGNYRLQKSGFLVKDSRFFVADFFAIIGTEYKSVLVLISLNPQVSLTCLEPFSNQFFITV